MFYLLHFWCSALHWMKSAQHCLYNSGKGRLTRYIWSNKICLYFGITFLLFFIKIENTFNTSFQNSTLLFINGFIFDIMNIQNNQSLEFEWIPMLAPLRSVNALSMLCKPKKEGKFKCKSWIKKLINCYFSQNITKKLT